MFLLHERSLVGFFFSALTVARTGATRCDTTYHETLPSNIPTQLDQMSNMAQPSSPPSTPQLLRPRTFMTRDIKIPDPIPIEGQEDALELMRTGRLFRYCSSSSSSKIDDGGTSIHHEEWSAVSLCESEIAAYTGHEFCVGVNSCGSALMLMLKATGLEPGGKVLFNAFTFGAVPSAIEHAGGRAVHVESNMDYVVDLVDLEKKLIEHPDCRHVLISHMRGKLGDMDAVAELCRRHNVILLEDCAHALGIHWKGQHTGHVGVACAISCQSYKVLNAGEGGFVLTNDPHIAAKTAIYAGAYEGFVQKHLALPPRQYFDNLSRQLPNYSLRMTNLAAAVLRPQIRTLDDRIEKYQQRYQKLVAQIEARVGGDYLSIPKMTHGVTRMVHDSLQFNLNADKFSPTMVQDFLEECRTHGLALELFGHASNARNFVNWEYAPTMDPLPLTRHMLARASDIRLPLMWDDKDFDDMANVICESIEAVCLSHTI